jgi:hypothetical protein
MLMAFVPANAIRGEGVSRRHCGSEKSMITITEFAGLDWPALAASGKNKLTTRGELS